jgi:hypothetical protein
VSAKQIAHGRHLAKRLPPPKVIERNGVKVVTQELEGLSADELLALSEFYRVRYGVGQ